MGSERNWVAGISGGNARSFLLAFDCSSDELIGPFESDPLNLNRTTPDAVETHFMTLLANLDGRQLSKLTVAIPGCYTAVHHQSCLLYTSPSPRDRQKSRMPSSA